MHHPADLGAGRQSVTIDVAYRQVAGVLLTGNAIRFDKMVSVLEARYGPASETLVGAGRR